VIEGSALRIGLLVSPVVVVSSGCGPSDEVIAATAIAALAVAYLIALVILALLAWLWRRTGEEVDVEWGWQLNTLVVLVVLAFASTLGVGIDAGIFAVAVLLETPFVVSILGGTARLALARDSKRWMRCAPILAAALVAVPNLLVFVVSPAAATRIIEAESIMLFWAGGAPWWLAVLALIVEAILVRHEPDSPD
jgi:hypothetical protein